MRNKAFTSLRRRGPVFVAACGAALLLLTGNGAALAQKNTGRSAKQTANAPACHTPALGSSERRAILDALRVPVQKEIEMRVVFVIDDPKRYFRVVGDWAFVNARYVHPDGTPMGKSYYAKMGDMSDAVQALLHRVKGKWHVVTAVVAVTDVEWEDWPKRYHAPAAVIPPAN